MAWLVLGYLISYIPYVMLLKTLVLEMSSAAAGPVDGLVLLPAAALGQLAVMPLLLVLSGWWRYARPGGPAPGRGEAALPPYGPVLAAGFFASLVVGTTTLAFTFTGTSVLLVLLLMRGGVLAISPLVDKVRGRHVTRSAWAALLCSLAAVLVALGGVRDHHLALPALLCLGVYLVGYVARFDLMSRVAKTGSHATDRRYFAVEHAAAPVFLVLLLAAGALAGHPALRTGFTSFLATPHAWTAAAVGVAYEVLFVFGTLIYLDRRALTWCVPANRCASLVSGLAAAYALHHLAGTPTPTGGELLALVLVVAAVAALSAPALAGLRAPAGRTGQVVFVCGNNTSRSPLAEHIARHEAARRKAAGRAGAPRFTSAGLHVAPAARRHRDPMSPYARAALESLGVHSARRRARCHRARPLTADLCRRSAVVYCMTGAQRDEVLALAPGTAARVLCLDPHGDIPNPAGQPPEVYLDCARRIRTAIRRRLLDAGGGGLHGGTPEAA
ncbi:arsenate reductase/protein-tyrosine-phosphatase family protein [Streptomyces fradiae]|uniref:arsenate reductase/protein-tyrosine-phosphatase family protein n=1 Tax=Streptomyces fradiae TaxID=1906 RepID=UPI0037F2FBBB